MGASVLVKPENPEIQILERWDKFVRLERKAPKLAPGHRVPRAELEAAWQRFARDFAASTTIVELVRFGLETDVHKSLAARWRFARMVVRALRRGDDVPLNWLAAPEGRAVRLVMAELWRRKRRWWHIFDK